jgi:hypothetical protein
MNKLRVFGLIGIGLIGLNQSLYANDWGTPSLLDKKNLSLPASSLQGMQVDVGAGSLFISGSDNLATIQVNAKVYGEDLEADDYSLYLENKDGVAVLYAHITRDSYQNERIDLHLTLPTKLALEVNDRSGDLEIENMIAGVSINDRSGDIELTNIKGGLQIDDRSGSIYATSVYGGVTINDRSGNILLKEIEGNTKITDRSGDIRVKTLAGNLDIEDSSGDVKVKSVTGVVSVDDTSGNIDVDGAENFVLLDDSSGDVELDNIRQGKTSHLK